MSGTELDIPTTANIADLIYGGSRDEVMREAIAGRQHELQRELAAGVAMGDDEGQQLPDIMREPRQPPRRRELANEPPQPQQPRMRDVGGVLVNDQQYEALARVGALTAMALNQPAPPPPVVDYENARRTVNAIQYGDSDQAVPALVGFIEDVVRRVPTGPAVDHNAIAHAAAMKIQHDQQYAVDSATIRREYADVFSHPQRQQLAALNVVAIRQRNAQEGRQQSDLDVYREAGNAVRGAMGTPTQHRATTSAPPRRDIVGEMRRNRGQFVA